MVAINARALRQRLGRSQSQVANDLGIDRTVVGRIERGLDVGSLATLIKLAAALDVPVEALCRPITIATDGTVTLADTTTSAAQ
jgi:transcriptional regulator with XRE-family HTH domain